MKIITDNKKARFEYQLLDKYEAGLSLMGSEVKSLRDGKVNLKDSYIVINKGEAFLQKAHISIFAPSSYNNHHPERIRKLLLNRHELNQLEKKVNERGYSIVPVKLYFKNGKVKIEIALAKGKSVGDKRESSKKRDHSREISRALRHSR